MRPVTAIIDVVSIDDRWPTAIPKHPSPFFAQGFPLAQIVA
jgi:hypothetical protein